MAQATLPAWIQTLRQRAPEFADGYMAQRERILRDGAIPAKYKHLMTMIVDALLSPPKRRSRRLSRSPISSAARPRWSRPSTRSDHDPRSVQGAGQGPDAR